MNILGRLTVLPNLPEKIARLDDLAKNLFWTWDGEARALFRQLDGDLWERTGHNPVLLLRDIAQARLEEAAADAAYVGSVAAVARRFDDYLAQSSWFEQSGATGHHFVYFCAEYGWHESIPIYSGGLGVLAGDHTKAASDLGVPLTGVGLWYPEGYFHQRVAADGRQEAVYESKSPTELPLALARTADGREARATVTVFGREVTLRAWRVCIGRTEVYLLDADLEENHPDDRVLLRRLYGGDQRTRIGQEIILGIGGVRMLRALDMAPTAWHMNEGHSAFMALERCRELVESGLSFAQAREVVAASTLFTVHTPVAAGNDAFAFDLIHQGFSHYWSSLGLDEQQFYDLGRADHGWGPVFSMPALALRFTSGRNGVARLHGATSRRIWNDLWPDVPTEEVPIGHVTNGVHSATWVAPEIQELLDRVLPDDWRQRLDDDEVWRAVEELDTLELWRVRTAMKARTIRFLRRRLKRQLERQEAGPRQLRAADTLFEPEALTIGFARRFATYKRATLIFHDLDRLARILGDPTRPVQLVFAGKAHPADRPGQALIAQIHNLSKDPRFAGKILFVEDYDMAVGRALTRGVDVWLNNPRRPLEASGTSGMKAAMNGVLNLSVLDGWWPEGFTGDNGWAIGLSRQHEDDEHADAADADALYDLLELEVVPLYYQRDADDLPQEWLERAKKAIASVGPRFSARRMVKEYVERYYLPASERAAQFGSDDFRLATELAAWRQQVGEGWSSVTLEATPIKPSAAHMGEWLELEARLDRGSLPDDIDVRVEVVYSRAEDELRVGLHRVAMEPAEKLEDGRRRYLVRFQPEISGELAYGVRAYPVHPALTSPFDAHAIRWA